MGGFQPTIGKWYDYKNYDIDEPQWRRLLNTAEKLENEFGDLFVYERDGSIGYGLEIISNPMTKGYYEKNINKLKKLLNILNEFHYVSTKGNKCGLHIHFNRKALGFNSKEYSSLLSNLNNNIRKAEEVDHKRANKTIENVVAVMELYREELIKISGRNKSSLRWCQFETSNGYDIEVIKKLQKIKLKAIEIVTIDTRLLILQMKKLLRLDYVEERCYGNLLMHVSI